jgi:hypothetical protein
MSLQSRNLRVCQVKYGTRYYDVMIAVNDLDEVNDILQEWALDTLGATLDLPAALIYNKDITEVLTSVNINSYAYVQSAEKKYMSVPRYAGIAGDPPALPTALEDGLYVMPETQVYLYSLPGYDGVLGEYTVPEKGLSITEGMNLIGIRYNAGTPEYIKYTTSANFDFSSIVPVALIISFSGTLYPISYGQSGFGLPEKLYSLREKAEIISSFTLDTDSLYVELSELDVVKGMSEVSLEAVDTAEANNDMFLYYKDTDQEWQKSAVTTINNTQYQSASGLASLAGGEFVVNYIYRLLDENSKTIFNVLSNKFASLAAAKESEIIQDTPDVIDESAVLVGRIIVEKDSTTPVHQKIQKITFGTVA